MSDNEWTIALSSFSMGMSVATIAFLTARLIGVFG